MAIEIQEWYEHKHSPSVFVMFTTAFQLIWCYSGNELRRIYLLNPERYISGPLELPLTEELDKKLTKMYDDAEPGDF